MKYLKLLFAALCSVLILASCENRDAVKVDSLTNTYWESIVDEYNYLKVWFYDNNRGLVLLRAYTSDEETSVNVGYSVKQSGYVIITMFPGTISEKEWMTGNFDKEKGTLKLGKLDMKYKGKAR